MEPSIREVNDILIITPQGKLMGGPESISFQELLKDNIDSGKQKFIVDLAKVKWMNSSGLAVLISALKTIRNSGGELLLANVTEKIQSILVITKLASVFKACDSLDEAIQSF
ncbi:MAG: STAS domain-containing protein [candidate division Zixibacteria bacterium]